MNQSIYSEEFYKFHFTRSVQSAEEMLPVVLSILPKINSVVDFGCGIGAWLSVCKSLNINHICGYDGDWVQSNQLVIPPESFNKVDLAKLTVTKRFDLAISLETAEHLPESCAESFISVISSSSDIILFGAAIPGYTDFGHINCQWQSYWVDLFAKQDYMYIDIRKLIWNNNKIAEWYRQNTLLYIKPKLLKDLCIPSELCDTSMVDIVHPLSYTKFLRYQQNLNNSNT